MGTNQLQLFKNPRSKRIQVGLDARTLDSLTRFSRAVGYPRSRVAAEMLQGIGPIMEDVADRMEELNRVGNLETIKESLGGMAQHLRELLDSSVAT